MAKSTAAYAWYALVVLVLATLLAFIDRQILVLAVEPLKHDLALSDVQIGALQGLGPALFSVLAALPLAWLSDRFERSVVLLGCVLFWSAATAARGFANDFTTLAAGTISLAVGEAALAPIVYSLIPDLFRGQSRIRANIIFFGTAWFGAGLGLTLGSLTLTLVEAVRPALPEALRSLAAWRLTFIAVALPGPLIALAIAFIGATPRALQTAHSEAGTHGILAYFRTHGRTAIGIYLASGFSAIAGGAIFAWMPAAIGRAFNVAPAAAGTRMGLTFTVAAAAGLAISTVTAPLWRRCAGVAAVPRALAVTCALAVIPTLLLGFSVQSWQAFALVGTLASLVITGLALVPTMLQDMAPPALRARLIAGSTVVSAIMGATGPMIVGALSDSAGGTSRGLLWSIVAVVSVCLVLCALTYRATEVPFRRTVAALQPGS